VAAPAIDVHVPVEDLAPSEIEIPIVKVATGDMVEVPIAKVKKAKKPKTKRKSSIIKKKSARKKKSV
jgi:hypothetical protein